MRPIRLGLGAWPSAVPFAWPLQRGMIAWPGEIVVADAAEIDERMALGGFHIGLVSAATYLRHQADWVRSAQLALVASGPQAQAAVLFSRHDLSLLDGTTFAVQPAAGGERALLEALMRAEHALVISTVERRGPLEILLRDNPAALMVGERALLTAQNLPDGVQAHDLTDLWHHATQMPFPVAVWVAKRTWREDHASEWADAQRLISQARDMGLFMLEAVLADWCSRRPIQPEALGRHLAAYRYEVDATFLPALTRLAQLAGLPPPAENLGGTDVAV
ncbi:MAG: hypothetical protein H7338_13565 [Candidatus Sericytochromatia bacterium]|nr:hypothetical protein [Candidatus Sericytochromatia bacterium]